ncbi:MAG: phosphatase PAP2 family protein [Proteobacteria bacterium]|nr:phosphatase PAP2 family protein [Pseudomonadota bacterium]
MALGLLTVQEAGAASPQWQNPPVSSKGVKPYFDSTSLHSQELPPPPAVDSLLDQRDVATVVAFQAVDAARRKEAGEDARWLFDRFEQAFGQGPIRGDARPALVTLLSRTLKQVGGPTFAAKAVHQRARPYQRMKLAQVCGRAADGVDDADADMRTSYPSGHAAYGWAVGLVLARVAPARAEALLSRAQTYAESRVVCGVHFPSDVEAGRQMATAVVAQLDRHAEFQRDLELAKAELTASPPAAASAPASASSTIPAPAK